MVSKLDRESLQQINLVHDHGDLRKAKQLEKESMPTGLVSHPFDSIDDEYRGIGARGPGNHVLEEFPMARRVDDHSVPTGGPEPNARRVDGDRLIAFSLKAIQHKRPFERHPAPLAHLPQFLDLALRQASGVVKKAADHRRLAMIDMADDDDAKIAIRFG